MNRDLLDWLFTFRRETPREQRQQLIDTFNLEEAIANLPRHYRRLIYVLGARALQYGPTFPVEARNAIVAAISTKVPRRHVAQDVSQMMTILNRHHVAWQARHARHMARSAEPSAGVATAKLDIMTSDL